MGYKPDVVLKAKFEYSPLGQVFNKGLDTSEKQVGLLKRLKNIEDKTDKQLEENKDNQLGVKSIGYTVRQELSQEAKYMLEKLNNQEKLINYKKLSFTGDNKKDYDFTNFSYLRELFRAIYYGEILISAVKREQDNFDDMIKILKDYKPKKNDNKKKKGDLVVNAQNFYDGSEMIVSAFKHNILPIYSGNYYYDLGEETSESDNEESEEDKSSVCKFEKLAIDLDKVLDPELVEEYFYSNSLGETVKQLKDLRRQDKTSVKYNNKKALLVVGLIRLENDIKNMPESEVKNKKIDLLKSIVRKIVNDIQILDDMPP